jgi:hypothetical protein
MPVYEVAAKGAKPRLIKAKTKDGARGFAANELEVTRPSGERLLVLAARGCKIEYATGVQADPQKDIEEP